MEIKRLLLPNLFRPYLLHRRPIFKEIRRAFSMKEASSEASQLPLFRSYPETMPLPFHENYPLLSAFVGALTGVAIGLCSALQAISQLDSLDRLTLKQLGEVPVVLSSKNPTQLFEAAVGSFVFDEKAIDSLPVDSIAEMPRYAPGVHIIRPSTGIWGVGMRGISSRFFNRIGFNVDQ